MHVKEFEITTGIFGRASVNYACPNCRELLTSLVTETDQDDSCPRCGVVLLVPSAKEIENYLTKRSEGEIARRVSRHGAEIRKRIELDLLEYRSRIDRQVEESRSEVVVSQNLEKFGAAHDRAMIKVRSHLYLGAMRAFVQLSGLLNEKLKSITKKRWSPDLLDETAQELHAIRYRTIEAIRNVLSDRTKPKH